MSQLPYDLTLLQVVRVFEYQLLGFNFVGPKKRTNQRTLSESSLIKSQFGFGGTKTEFDSPQFEILVNFELVHPNRLQYDIYRYFICM